jgi:hypothetical protein
MRSTTPRMAGVSICKVCANGCGGMGEPLAWERSCSSVLYAKSMLDRQRGAKSPRQPPLTQMRPCLVP